jgi:hypothetical protein
MPDFERLVADRLARLDLTPAGRRAVVAEVSAHLEEFYRARVAAGSADPEGETLAQVADWNRLRRRIERAKEERMRIARAVVLPGLGAVILAWITFRLGVFYLVQPAACPPDVGSHIGDVVDSACTIVSANTPMYFAWLATLPFAGALAALLARRAGARPAERLAAALLPALALAVEVTVAGVMSGFFWRIPIYWVLAPAVICALGAWPFLGGPENHRYEVMGKGATPRTSS